MFWKKLSSFMGLLMVILNFFLLSLPISKGNLKPEPTEIIIGQNFEVDIPDPETEVSFCFRLEEPQSLKILSTDYFEISQNDLVGKANMDDNGYPYFDLTDATGCWTIKRYTSLKMRFINDYSDIQFQNYDPEKEDDLVTWKWQFGNFFFWCLVVVLGELPSAFACEKSTTTETEDSEDDLEFEDCIEEGCCTHCGSELPEDSDNCSHCGAPQNQKEE